MSLLFIKNLNFFLSRSGALGPIWDEESQVFPTLHSKRSFFLLLHDGLEAIRSDKVISSTWLAAALWLFEWLSFLSRFPRIILDDSCSTKLSWGPFRGNGEAFVSRSPMSLNQVGYG